MKNLEKYGWNAFYDKHYHQYKNEGLLTGRILSIQGFKYLLITEIEEIEEIEAELSGKMLFGKDAEDLPKVGDWVIYILYEHTGYIIDLLPRMNALSRKCSGNRTGIQVLAVNIDYALIVQGIDRDFNLARLERYIVQVLACGIEPIIVLNKADLAENPEFFKEKVKLLHRDCPVYLCSTYTNEGIPELIITAFNPEKTYILIGSSGVGKSSLLNAIKNDIRRETGTISKSTGKGKHITTTRDLFRLANGSLVIDTPGMREFGIAFDSSFSADALFPAIDGLARNCRYADCKHISENGCAVLSALENGTLESIQYANYMKLFREQEHFAIKVEEKKRIGKQFGKMVREAKEFKKKNNY